MDTMDKVRKNAEYLLKTLPPHVTLLAAAKTRTVEEVQAAYAAGIRYFGHNYVQEAQAMIQAANFTAHWHMIGHLQRNKSGGAVELFDMIESLDSIRLANELEKRCTEQNKTIEVLIEVNSGAEEDKTGALPQEVVTLAQAVSALPHMRLAGLMTMGPLSGEAELARPYFRKTRELFEQLRNANLPNIEMRVLSMGMSGSYRVAVEEGATMVRIGTLLFGPRD
ncbi:MAG: YggS family pyridoxal phosphate-dependent enzyme [Anaerolineaceae bacterium]|nr:YggS family pyridoxal phosphate-dependent enzyme [Anaerolineaceae bacterium]